MNGPGLWSCPCAGTLTRYASSRSFTGIGDVNTKMIEYVEQVRKEAMAGLDSLLPRLTPAARILLARRFSVRSWLLTGLIDIVKEVTEGKLTNNEIMDAKEFSLDMATIANIFYACFRAKSSDEELRSSLKTGGNNCIHKSAFGGTSAFGGPSVFSGTSASGGSYPSNCSECERLRQAQILNTRLLRYGSVVDEIFGTELRACRHLEF